VMVSLAVYERARPGVRVAGYAPAFIIYLIVSRIDVP
jgi:hypothetical protein